MHYHGPAIICAARPHGEHGVILRAMTCELGLLAGYVQGGRSGAMRPVLQPGNQVMLDCRARTENQLPSMRVEPGHSRAALHGEPLAAAGLEWVTALTARALPEQLPFPGIWSALEAVLMAIEAAPAAREWVGALVRYELLLLAELGFGLDLSGCAVTGRTDNLAYVSPRSGCAVSHEAGEGYRDRLLPYPAFLQHDGHSRNWQEMLDGLRLTGHFLERDILHGHAAAILPARRRLIDRLHKMVA